MSKKKTPTATPAINTAELNATMDAAMKKLEQDIIQEIFNSEMWLLVSLDEKGVHVRTPDPKAFGLLAVVLSEQPELYKDLQDTIALYEEDKKTRHEKENNSGLKAV